MNMEKEKMAYCTNCGKQLPDGAAFCTECGKPVSPAPQDSTPSNAGNAFAFPAGVTPSPAGPVTDGSEYVNTGNGGSTYAGPVNIPPRTLGPAGAENRYGDAGNGYYTYGGPASGSAGPAAPINAGLYVSAGNNGPWQGTAPAASPVRAPRDEALIGRIREIGGSPLHLVLILCMAATAVLTVLSRGSAFFGIPTGSSDGSLIGSLIGCLPVILAVAGLATFYSECRNEGELRGNGLGLYKASKIMLIIFFVLAIAATVLGTLAIFAIGGLSALKEALEQAGLDSSPYGSWLTADFVTGMIAFILIAFVIACVLAIVMQAKLIKGANIVRDALETGTKGEKLPVFPLVIEVIMAVLFVLGAVGMIGSEIAYIRAGSADAAATVLPLISSVINVAQAVLAVILLSKIRKAVNE